MTQRAISFEQARARYVHRFTCDHVPAWVRETPGPDGQPWFYAPTHGSDQEWYDHTTFPGEQGYTSDANFCDSKPTWPYGQRLKCAYVYYQQTKGRVPEAWHDGAPTKPGCSEQAEPIGTAEEIAVLQERVADLEKDLIRAKGERDYLSRVNKELRQSHAERTAEREVLQADIRDKDKMIEALAAKIERQQDGWAEMHRQREVCVKELEAMRMDMQSVQAREYALKQANAALVKQRDELETEVTELKGELTRQVEEKTHQADEWHDEYQQAAKEREALKADALKMVAEHGEDLASIERAYRKEREDLKADIEAMRAEHKAYSDMFKETYNLLTQEKNKLLAEAREHRTQKLKLVSERNQALKGYEDQGKVIENLKDENRVYKPALDDLRRQMAGVSQECEALRASNKIAKATIQRLTDENEKLKVMVKIDRVVGDAK